MSELRRVIDIAPIYQVISGSDDNYIVIGGGVRYPVGLRLYLENEEIFEMYYVPPEVIEALQMIRRGDPPPRRQSLFSLLAFHDEFKDIVDRSLERIVIDEYDEATGVYTATAHFESDGLHVSIKMIPSHAVFLALVADKPIYVSQELVDLSSEIEDVDDEDEDEEEYGASY